MSYSTDRAILLADLLERLATQHLHQLAGQLANIDFWVDEVAAAFTTIDEYPRRFRRLRDAQVEFVQSRDVRVTPYCPVCEGGCEFGPQSPVPPRRVPSQQLAAARERLRKAMRRFLLRLHRASLVDEATIRQYCDRLDINVETEDFDH